MVKIILKITGHVLDENKFGRFDMIVITTKYENKYQDIFFFNFTIKKIEHRYKFGDKISFKNGHA